MMEKALEQEAKSESVAELTYAAWKHDAGDICWQHEL
jgi:hypothetical protein